MSDSSGEELQRIYHARFGANLAYRNRFWSVLAEYFSQWIEPKAHVLDLGAGYCGFINAIPAAEKYALDLNPDTRRHANSDVRVLEQDSTAPWKLDASLDAVFTSNFLEHLRDKELVKSTVTQAYRSLGPGGRFIALGPNIRYLPGAYWDFYDHYVPLTDASLSELLVERGFSIEERIARFLPYTMSEGREYPMWTLRLYLKMPVAWPAFGKQFLVVAKKPA